MKYQKIVILATHGGGEPPKTLDVGYVENIKYYFDNPDKSPFNLIMGDTLDHGNTVGIIACIKRGNRYGIKLKCCNYMFGIYA